MPLQATSGAASYDAFGGGVPVEPVYIEQIFQTYLYTGNGSTQTINNGIDLAGKGGLVWMKNRGGLEQSRKHILVDTVRGGSVSLSSNNTSGNDAGGAPRTFLSNGFSIDGDDGDTNRSPGTYVSWTFREQPKFFDVVTYTGAGNPNASRQIAHSLGSVPGFILIKATNTTSDWYVCARSGATTYATGLSLNSTAAAGYNGVLGAPPTSTYFDTTGIFDAGAGNYPNQTGVTYVAYLFAHNAGGFGLSGTDNVISCGGYTGNNSGVTINLGYEAQFVMVKKTNGDANWSMWDIMRGMPVSADGSGLYPNTSGAEASGGSIRIRPTATGFEIPDASDFVNITGGTYIYIAIRRGPMRTPTTGTSVFGLSARTGTGANATVTGSAGVTDLAIVKARALTPVWLWASRLTGTGYLSSNATTAETAAGTAILQANPWDVMDGVKVGINSQITNDTSRTYINYLIDRAPGFFDEVCYTGTGSNLTLPHNLTVAPELVIAKVRSTGSSWGVSTSVDWTKYLLLNSTNAQASASLFGTPDATNIYPTASGGFSGSGNTYVAYLFASCPGVSKVFSFTGNGSTQTINCGFTGGARFVLLKASSATGGWFTYDTARGMTVLTDPYLQLNSTAAETATLGSVTTVSTGFAVNEAITTGVNTSGVTYIGLAIS